MVYKILIKNPYAHHKPRVRLDGDANLPTEQALDRSVRLETCADPRPRRACDVLRRDDRASLGYPNRDRDAAKYSPIGYPDRDPNPNVRSAVIGHADGHSNRREGNVDPDADREHDTAVNSHHDVNPG